MRSSLTSLRPLPLPPPLRLLLVVVFGVGSGLFGQGAWEDGRSRARAADEAPGKAGPPLAKFAAADLDFFEKKIRPVLVEHCQKCHSADAVQTNQLKGGLLVDSRQGLLQGGDSGPAVVPGNLEDSLLLDALRYDSFQMPPKGKLPAEVIADFETWIERGAADPRQGSTPVKRPGIDIAAGRKFWCYQPVRSPSLPSLAPASVTGAATAGGTSAAGDAPRPLRTSIDHFIQAQLDARRLQPLPTADRATLLRRLYFDLHGLPPTPDEVDAFVADDSVDAYERLVERLCASPRFGERWGRHWLDVARYGESVTLRGILLPEAWRYRDYVIHSFNADRSFADFLREQVAGDLMIAANAEERVRLLTAVTYLTLGNTNLEEQDKKQLRMDVVDEQLETIGKGMLAQTIGCARCHDHKFDPIPTRDYYALAGILRNVRALDDSNVSAPIQATLPVSAEEEEMHKRHETQVAALQAKIKSLKDAIKQAASKPSAPATQVAGAAPVATPRSSAAGVVDPKSLRGVVVDDAQAKVIGAWKVSQFKNQYIGVGYLQDQNNGKGEKTATFIPELPRAGRYEVRLAYMPGANRCEDVPVTIFSADGEKTVRINQRESPSIDGRFETLGEYRFEPNGQGFVIVANEGTQGHVVVDAVQFLPLDAATDAANVAAVDAANAAAKKRAAVAPAAVTPAATPPPVATGAELVVAGAKPAPLVALEDQLKTLEKEVKLLTDNGPRRPKVMAVREEKTIEDAHVHVRGSVHNLGEKVPRGFLQVATYGQPSSVSANESGRRELGDWLASPDNPLTARVAANRVWHWLTGEGLVRTTDNFGSTGELPSHPELLDHLAVRLVESDWSIKSLVREIVLSETYRRSTADHEKNRAADPENRLLWRMNRRRLDAECLQDAVLAVSGELRLETGGRTFKPNLSADYGFDHATTLRAVYWPGFRNARPEFLEVFDMADASMVTGRRNTSTVSPQALFLMNDRWIITRSRAAARRLADRADLTEAQRVREAYRWTLGRLPTPTEERLALQFLASSPDWPPLFQALFASLDFRHLE